MNDVFVTGTNTEVGKTWISQALLLGARRRGLRTIAVKPVAAGCETGPEGLRNEDALALQRVISEPLDYSQINPIALEQAIAPHIAAELAGKRLSVGELEGHCKKTLSTPHDFAIIEGAGGWRVPLNERETLADLARALQTPIILVVGMGLGCLNHALLSVEAIERDGLQLAAWVANSPGSAMPYLEQNLATLRQQLPAPCLGHVPFIASGRVEAALEYLCLDQLFS